VITGPPLYLKSARAADAGEGLPAGAFNKLTPPRVLVDFFNEVISSVAVVAMVAPFVRTLFWTLCKAGLTRKDWHKKTFCRH
jgi:hypothetical protein